MSEGGSEQTAQPERSRPGANENQREGADELRKQGPRKIPEDGWTLLSLTLMWL